MPHAVVDADGHSAPGEVEAHRVLASCQGEQTGGVDGSLQFDGGANAGPVGADRW
ncbi:MAG: hypothetical protein ACRDRM_11445 [Pseudonocardiaceae bacterium]